MNTGELLNELRSTMDTIDELNQSLNAVKKHRKDIERQILDESERTGTTSYGNDAITVTVKEDFIAAYDPEHWNDLIDYASKTKNYQIVQRRLSTKPIAELIDNGAELPEGVRLEPITKINARRK